MEWKRLRHREMREGEKCKGKAKRNERDENEERTADSTEGHARQGVGMGLVPIPTVAEYTRAAEVTAPAPQPAAPLAFVLRLERVAVGRERPLPPQQGLTAEHTAWRPASRPAATERSHAVQGRN